MKKLLISASNSRESINEDFALRIRGVTGIKLLNLKDYQDIPMLSKTDFEEGGVPPGISEIFGTIAEHDYLILFTPEHNGYFSSFFKNILDWLSLVRKDFLSGKVVLIVAISNTRRDIRLMEGAARNTLGIFGPDEVVFLNLNRYGEADVSEYESAVLSLVS